ncbi:hypothetical protein EDD17DRAFT_1748884 [Pisolithus thermaeus]|nr:hypothetical protein EDD17DRAFT_1748884 [Pisolithus thermaeus]
MSISHTRLYGITTLQTYLYYMYYSEDSLLVKLLVATIWILDSLHISFMCYMLYYYLIINYGVPTALAYIVWSYQVTVLINMLVIFAVQCFFAHKIHYLYHRKVRWFVTVPIMVLVIAAVGFGLSPYCFFNFMRAILIKQIAAVFVTAIRNETSVLTRTWYYGVTPSVGTAVLAEILITVSLCVLLYDNGLRSAVPRTKRLLNSLITYAANRCLLTSIVAIAELSVVRMTDDKMIASLLNIFQNADQQAAWTMGLNFIIGKLYANSFLASLNTRQYLRSRDSALEADGLDNAVHLANLSKHLEDGRGSKVVGGRSNVREVAVVCTTTTMTFSDPAFDNTPIP